MRWSVIVGFLAMAAPAMAADEARDMADGARIALYLQAGATSGPGSMGGGGGALGGNLVIGLSRRLSVELGGALLGGMGSSDLTGSTALLLNLRTGKTTMPYLAVGGGVYRSDMHGDPMMRGGGMGGAEAAGMMPRASSGMMGSGTGATMMAGHGTTGMMGNAGTGWTDNGDGRWGGIDPAVSVGGGLRIDVGSRVFIRPDARALVVLDGGDPRTVGLFTASVGYRF